MSWSRNFHLEREQHVRVWLAAGERPLLCTAFGRFQLVSLEERHLVTVMIRVRIRVSVRVSVRVTVTPNPNPTLTLAHLDPAFVVVGRGLSLTLTPILTLTLNLTLSLAHLEAPFVVVGGECLRHEGNVHPLSAALPPRVRLPRRGTRPRIRRQDPGSGDRTVVNTGDRPVVDTVVDTVERRAAVRWHNLEFTASPRPAPCTPRTRSRRTA